MRVAIHQPNYAPWGGYFAKLRACDLFIFLDDVQMPRGRSYVSRTQIHGPSGPQWLSVPTHHMHDTRICDVRFAEAGWPRRHLAALRARYGRSPHFAEVYALLAPLYEAPGELLAPFNMRLMQAIAVYLGCARPTRLASEFAVAGSGDDRLIALLRAAGADTYLSGPGGQKYQTADKFAAAALRLEVKTYVPIPYPQADDGFVPGLSVLDMLFTQGRRASDFLVYQ